VSVTYVIWKKAKSNIAARGRSNRLRKRTVRKAAPDAERSSR
jgi:hypothetical protein